MASGQRGAAGDATSDWPGKAYGIPADGPGAVAGLGQRVGAFLLDAGIAALLAWAFTAPEPPKNWSLLVWGVITVLGVAAVGTTPGHLIAGTRVATFGAADRSPRVALWAVPRAVLVGLVIPPFVQDRDARGLHDRLCHTIVVRTR